MRASFSKTKHIFPLLASKCRTPWWIQGMWDDVALDYCCCFLAFPVCSLQCLQGEWVWNSAVMEQWKKSGDRFLRWECCWKNWLLSVLPACLLSYRCWLQPCSFVWLLITLCCLSVWLSNLQSTCAAGIPSMKHDARGRFDFLKSEIISFSLDWYREGVNIQMCNNYYRRVTLVSFHHVFTP